MKLTPITHPTEHEIGVTDHPAMFGFDVVIKFKQDSSYIGLLTMFRNVTKVHWMQRLEGYSSKAIEISSFIHNSGNVYESYDIEWILVEMATKMTTGG